MAEINEIVFDKTGTLSSNYFQIKEMWSGWNLYNSKEKTHFKLSNLFGENAVLEECITQSMEDFNYTAEDEGNGYLSNAGNPLDNALIDLLQHVMGDANLKHAYENNKSTDKIYEFPYSERRGTSSYAIKYEDKVRIFVNGRVPDVLDGVAFMIEKDGRISEV
jgi:magnesium-transporting ATPase (P-type)